ncbi:3108_t:CDS:1 [Funneliformis caledonium]|uniref:3108_t:CDS:1 n=1 Tax=Funneliformis caledonium TaxID=1117310 RepID=A0A9N9HLR2_9GLOM|nr:3108_t:CDS:1 [Funneliformis caledonium]
MEDFNNDAMTVEHHKIHYYENGGNIFIKAENTIFLLHKSILSLSSEFFEDLFKLSKPSTNENVNIIEGTQQSSNTFPTIEINGETSESIERMLSFIYPNTFVEITWDNVKDFLRISDKFIINKLLKSCSGFLLQHYQENILLSFTLAERYNLGTVFKESSKLLLDDLQKYRSEPIYDELSLRTKLKLMDAWYHYTNSLHKYFKIVSKRAPKQFREFLHYESPNFFLKPSKFSKFYNDCEIRFSRVHYEKTIPTIEELLKDYEELEFQPIQLDKDNKDNEHNSYSFRIKPEIRRYIFIELKN